MTHDIVKQLRAVYRENYPVMDEAADEIERLRETEGSIKRLFNGTRSWMADGDEDQWAAYDFLKERYAATSVKRDGE